MDKMSLLFLFVLISLFSKINSELRRDLKPYMPPKVKVDSPKSRIKMSDLKVLLFRRGERTKSKRTDSVAQIQCMDGSAKCVDFQPEIIYCYNNRDYTQETQWECQTLPSPKISFGNAKIYCEGFEYPEDPYILRGSCFIEYTAVLKARVHPDGRGFNNGDISKYAVVNQITRLIREYQVVERLQAFKKTVVETIPADVAMVVVAVIVTFVGYMLYCDYRSRNSTSNESVHPSRVPTTSWTTISCGLCKRHGQGTSVCVRSRSCSSRSDPNLGNNSDVAEEHDVVEDSVWKYSYIPQIEVHSNGNTSTDLDEDAIALQYATSSEEARRNRPDLLTRFTRELRSLFSPNADTIVASFDNDVNNHSRTSSATQTPRIEEIYDQESRATPSTPSSGNSSCSPKSGTVTICGETTSDLETRLNAVVAASATGKDEDLNKCEVRSENSASPTPLDDISTCTTPECINAIVFAHASPDKQQLDHSNHPDNKSTPAVIFTPPQVTPESSPESKRKGDIYGYSPSAGGKSAPILKPRREEANYQAYIAPRSVPVMMRKVNNEDGAPKSASNRDFSMVETFQSEVFSPVKSTNSLKSACAIEELVHNPPPNYSSNDQSVITREIITTSLGEQQPHSKEDESTQLDQSPLKFVPSTSQEELNLRPPSPTPTHVQGGGSPPPNRDPQRISPRNNHQFCTPPNSQDFQNYWRYQQSPRTEENHPIPQVYRSNRSPSPVRDYDSSVSVTPTENNSPTRKDFVIPFLDPKTLTKSSFGSLSNSSSSCLQPVRETSSESKDLDQPKTTPTPSNSDSDNEKESSNLK